MTAVLDLDAISKRFGSVTALDRVSLTVNAGEIHGLLGENGAGKSTLMHILFGMVPADSGRILLRGRPTMLRSPRAAKAAGIGMVHQHFTSVPTFTVAENLWLAAGRVGAPAGAPPTQTGSGVARLQARLWAGLDPAAPTEMLPVGAKQRLEILQALATGADTLLLDEPTAVLTPAEVRELLVLLREFADGGGTVVLITHKLAEVFAAVDRVTVLRAGRVTATGPIGDHSPASLARAMVGESASPTPRSEPRPGPRVVVRSGGFEAREGEIIGVAAVEGNGQRELLRQLAGAAGEAGAVAFVPEDRTTEGMIPTFSLTENLVLGLAADPRWRRGWWLDWAAARTRTAALLQEFGVRASGPDAPARSLSGGNQQKVIFARALETQPRVLIAENPTRGLDLAATAFVHGRLREAAAAGGAVVVYSSDLDEVLELATRVVVVFRGAFLPVPPGADRETIGALMTSGGPP